MIGYQAEFLNITTKIIKHLSHIGMMDKYSYFDMVWFGPVRSGPVRSGPVRSGPIRFDLIRFDSNQILLTILQKVLKIKLILE